MTSEKAHHVVIVGGGFAGLHTAMQLAKAPVQVTLVDRRNFHLFQPLLYQVATGALSPANIATPLRSVLKRQSNARVFLGDVVDVDPAGHRLILQDHEIKYDTLVMATGAHHQYFGHEEWSTTAPGLKTIEDATDIRHRVLRAFEAAEQETDPDRVLGLLTFVVVGGGPTGAELAGALCEIARHTLRKEFRSIDPAKARVILLDRAPRILPSYPEDLSAKAAATLRQLGVEVRTGVTVKNIDTEEVLIEADGKDEHIRAHTVLWAAGVEASHMGRILADKTGAELDAAERLIVEPDLTVPGYPEIFVIGDLAHTKGEDGRPLPGVAPVAIQQGKYTARLICRRLAGQAMAPFRYRNLGSMATLGRSHAVVEMGKVHLSGLSAWLIWLFVHLMSLVQFQNRVLVLTQWAWNYLTWSRSARLITGEVPPGFRHTTNE